MATAEPFPVLTLIIFRPVFRGDDREADHHVQPHPTGRHHRRAHRDHLRRCRALKKATVEAVLIEVVDFPLGCLFELLLLIDNKNDGCFLTDCCHFGFVDVYIFWPC